MPLSADRRPARLRRCPRTDRRALPDLRRAARRDARRSARTGGRRARVSAGESSSRPSIWSSRRSRAPRPDVQLRSVGPVVLTGFSQGAGVALTLAARHPERYAGVVAVAGWFEERLAPLPERAPQTLSALRLPERRARRSGGPNNRRTAERMDRAGIATRVRIYPGLGHEYPPAAERDRELDQALRFAFAR